MSSQLPAEQLLPHPIPKRRKRSEFSEADCLRVLREFARKVDRMKETSEDFDWANRNAADGRITVKFSAVGNFGTATDLFEAIRVMAGYKLPRGRR